MNLVSIIIPNFNHSQFLNQRIDSVLGQTYQNFEVVLLDDASLDNSREIINQYANHPKVSHVVLNDRNSGSVFSQWFKGIALAKGNYVWIAESDDFCETDFLEKVMQVFDSDNELGLVYTGSYSIDAIGNTLWTSPNTDSIDKWKGVDFINEKMVKGNAIYNASMAVFNKKFITKETDIIKSFSFCGDWLFWILLAKNAKVAYVGKLLNYFRNHDKDLSGKSYQSGLYFKEYKILLKELQDRNIISSKKMRHVLYLKLPLIADQIYEPSLKAEALASYKSELNWLECLSWKFESAIWQRVKFRLNKFKEI